MAAKKILFTTAADPLLGEVLFQHLCRTDHLLFCLCRPASLPAKFNNSAVPERVAFIDWQNVVELRVDEIWHSSTTDQPSLAELLSRITNGAVPVINYVGHDGVNREREQALDLLYPNEASRRGSEETRSSIEIEFLAAQHEFGLNYRIFKPVNLVNVHGDWPTSLRNDFYDLLDQVVSFKQDVEQKIERYFQRRPLQVRSDLALNLLPIEEAAERMFEIAASKQTLNGSYRVAGEVSVSLKGYLDALAENIGMQIEHVSPSTPLDAISAIFSSEIRLAACQTEEIRDTNADCTQLIHSFLKHHAHSRLCDRIGEPMTLREVKLDDGELLNYYAGGRGERTIVIVNAYGQGVTYWTKFATQLEENYRLLVWLPRGSGPEHLEQLRTMLATEGVESCDFVGWCTGPKLILDYYSSYPEQVTSMIFLGATFKNVPGQAQLDTDYERGLEPLLKMIEARPELSGRLKVALQGVLVAGKTDDRSNAGDSNSVMQMLGFPCPDLKEAVMGPFATDEGVVDYARQILEFWNHDVSKLFQNVRVPALFVTGECDRIASPRMAEAAAQLVPGARYVEIKGGSHYLQYEKSSLTACIVDQFLRDAVERRLTHTRSA